MTEQSKIDLPQQPIVLSGENVIEQVPPSMTSPAITSWQNTNANTSEESPFHKFTPRIEVKFDYLGQSGLEMQPSRIVISSRNQALNDNMTAPGDESAANHGARNLPNSSR